MDTLVETPWGEDSEEDVAETTVATEEVVENSTEDLVVKEKETYDVLALPIRAKPLFLNNDEDVVEFTISESKDGLESTSIIVGEGLFRIVETKMHQDGVPRIDLKMVLDSELTGFQHLVEKPSVADVGISGGLFLFGLMMCLFPFQFTMILGVSAILLGIKSAPQYLEKHRLVFSSCGSTHTFDLDLIGVFKPTFRASMALIGPTLAEYMKTGEIDSTTIDELHSGLRTPIPAPQPLQLEAPIISEIPVGPPVPVIEGALPNAQPPVEVAMNEEQEEIKQETTPLVIIPAPPQIIPQPNPLPPPQAIPQPDPLPPPPQVTPQPNPLPPPPAMPQPSPMPLPPAILPNQPPMQGFDSASLPLDAPLPEAPRIPVTAAPQEQVISQEEQDALMDELS